jgi:hypothetical protein
MQNIYIVLYILSYFATFLICSGWFLAEINSTQTFRDELTYKKEVGSMLGFNLIASLFLFIWLIASYCVTGLAHYGWTLKIKK